MDVLPECVSVHHVCAVPTEDRDVHTCTGVGHWSSWAWTYKWLLAAMGNRI